MLIIKLEQPSLVTINYLERAILVTIEYDEQTSLGLLNLE